MGSGFGAGLWEVCLKFLSELHRSIFDPSFYWKVLSFKKAQVFFFVLKLLIFTSLVSGLAKSYYLVHPQRGISTQVETLLNGIEIKDGRLEVNRDVPYVAPKEMAVSVVNRLVGFSNLLEEVPDTFLVVDTREADEWSTKPKPQILLKSSHVIFDWGVLKKEVPYQDFLGSRKDFSFSADGVREFLRSRYYTLLGSFVYTNLLFGSSMTLLTIFFLSLSAYMFRADKMKGIGYYIKIACFSITPVLVGTSLVAVSGVRADWTLHIFIIISTVVMFRAMAYTSARALSEEKKKSLE